jgi:hypothetical protein
LGYEVFLGAFFLAGGFYYPLNALRLGNTVKPETGAAYLLLGLASIIAGLGLILTFGYAY